MLTEQEKQSVIRMIAAHLNVKPEEVRWVGGAKFDRGVFNASVEVNGKGYDFDIEKGRVEQY